ncbi:TylF/MycF/NovP-related O-methyltransferase [Telluribacter sp.]|jgi:hypothetical protein|uniref:TylF/MycF/NovP-related O-methyltransferase n=1 Tax=Telluribacter sp. TaxID=1978767 RepID=UPI002E142B4A|nr:TylF/MycF/NovP-related O-methyltransferase [Telluribacter sp.]
MMRNWLTPWLNPTKKEVRQQTQPDPWRYVDIEPSEKTILEQVQPFTMTSTERLITLIRAVEYIVDQKIEGDFVECGVWKGGSAMAIVLHLLSKGVTDRQIYLYDTFEGMSEPTDLDKSFDGQPALTLLQNSSKEESNSVWCYSTLDEVKQNLATTAYPDDRIRFIKGKVEETIPKQGIPEKIALLRLDTDWYESTRHELEHLFPRLQSGGILIIDDYGHWEGCRRAVDEYIREYKIKLFLNRVDYTCRLAVKP